MGEKRNTYRILVGKPGGKRPLERPRHRRIVERYDGMVWYGMDWIDVAQDRDQWRAVVNTVIDIRFPLNAGKFLSSCTIVGFSGRSQLCG
jgi:hypothetical protein